jgi:hypothetical protein
VYGFHLVNVRIGAASWFMSQNAGLSPVLHVLNQFAGSAMLPATLTFALVQARKRYCAPPPDPPVPPVAPLPVVPPLAPPEPVVPLSGFT